MRRLLAACMLTLGGLALLAAQVPDTSELPYLPEPRETFRVGIAELIAKGVPAERQFVTTTLPILVYDSLRAVDEREMGEAELEAYAEERLAVARRAGAKALAEAVATRDALLFQDEASQERLEEATDAVAVARRTWLRLSDAEAADLASSRGEPTAPSEASTEGSPGIRADEPADPAVESRPIEFLALHEAGQLLPAPLATVLDNPLVRPNEQLINESPELARLAEEHDLDLLIFGFAEQRAGYVVLDLYAYHRMLDEVELLSQTTRLAEEIGDDAELVADEAAELILGRPWARLAVRADRSDASVRINGELVGFGEGVLRYAEAGEYSVEIEASGSEPIRQLVQLDADQNRTIVVEMEEVEGNLVRLRSSPSEAAVYIDSVWVGETPLVYVFPIANASVRLRKPGYLESRFVVGPDSPPVVSRALIRDDVDWTEELKEARDGFYQSFSLFVLSVPATVALRGSYLNLENAIIAGGTNLDNDRRNELVRQANSRYWASWGSFLLNAGLLVNVVINVIDYVRVGEGAHNQ